MQTQPARQDFSGGGSITIRQGESSQVTKPRQAPIELGGDSRKAASGAFADALRTELHARGDAHFGVLVHEFDEGFQGVIKNEGVGVEQQHVFRGSCDSRAGRITMLLPPVNPRLG